METLTLVTKYEIHQFAKLFPLIDGLVDEIAAELRKTCRPPTIILFEGKVLDGRHRYLASVKAGLEPVIREFTGKDARAFVVRNNITRRHLTTEERANLAAELATRPRGRPENLSNDRISDDTPSVKEAAKLLKVSESSVHRAKAKKAGKPAKPKPKDASDLETKLVNLVMRHIDQIEPQAFLDGLCKLMPSLQARVAKHAANGKGRVAAPNPTRSVYSRGR